MGQQERERINRPNTLPAICRTKGLNKSREELAGCGPAQPHQRQEAGGRGKGQARPKDRIPYCTANRPSVSNQRLHETLDGRHPLRQRAQVPDRRGQGLGLGTRRAEGALHLGRVRPSSSWLPEPIGCGRHKKQAQLFVLRICGTPEGWNRAQHRARSILSSGEPEQHSEESSTAPSPQRNGTSNLNKRPPPPACVRAEIKH